MKGSDVKDREIKIHARIIFSRSVRKKFGKFSVLPNRSEIEEQEIKQQENSLLLSNCFVLLLDHAAYTTEKKFISNNSLSISAMISFCIPL